MTRVSVELIAQSAKAARIAAAASAVVLGIAAAPAHGAAEGALTELTGPGSCLTQTPMTTGDCAPLAGLPDTPTAGGDIGPPGFSADGRNVYLGTARPDRRRDDGAGMLYALSRD